MLKDYVVNVPVVAATEGPRRSVKHLREKLVTVRPTGAAWDIDIQISYDEAGTWADFSANVTAAAEIALVDGNGWPLLCTDVRVVTNAGGVPGDPVAAPCEVKVLGYMDLG